MLIKRVGLFSPVLYKFVKEPQQSGKYIFLFTSIFVFLQAQTESRSQAAQGMLGNGGLSHGRSPCRGLRLNAVPVAIFTCHFVGEFYRHNDQTNVNMCTSFNSYW